MQHVDLIAEYLMQLERELVGVDTAVAHDALVDAEAHLRAAIAAGKTPAAAIEEFGRAADFARAYAPAPIPPVGGAGSTLPAPSAVGTVPVRAGVLTTLFAHRSSACGSSLARGQAFATFCCRAS